jgi:hypothetical protein
MLSLLSITYITQFNVGYGQHIWRREMGIKYKTIYWIRDDTTFPYKILRFRSLDAVERYCERFQYVTVFELKDATCAYWEENNQSN